MKTRFLALISVAFAACVTLNPQTSRAMPVLYELTELGGDRYEYTYELVNDLDFVIEQFTVFFDLGLFANLSVTASPTGWDSLAIQPEPAIPDDGFFDACSSDTLCFGDGVGLAPGESLGGFAVAFDWLGTGRPGGQPYDVVDPLTFASLASGTTLASAPSQPPGPRPPAEVPEPSTAALMLGGLLAAGAARRRQRPHGESA
jgi:hypothetical protein